MKQITLWLIRTYKRFYIVHREILRNLHIPGSDCRFKPTCSEYTLQAVEKYGSLKGLWLGLKRIFRCNPWVTNTYDPLL